MQPNRNSVGGNCSALQNHRQPEGSAAARQNIRVSGLVQRPNPGALNRTAVPYADPTKEFANFRITGYSISSQRGYGSDVLLQECGQVCQGVHTKPVNDFDVD